MAGAVLDVGATTSELCAIVAAWFLCSVITEVYDKTIMMELAAPLTLALWKFIVSVPCGAIAVLVSGRTLSRERIFRGAVLRSVMPLAGLIVGAKLLTYISYGYVPLSTAQIVKAATPIVTVFMTRSILGETFGPQSYLSLVPIAAGVCLAVGLDAEFNLLGIIAALLSCAFAAAQSICMKSLFISEDASSSFDALTLNLLSATCCASMLLPVWLGVQFGVVPATVDGGKLMLESSHALFVGGERIWIAFFVGAMTQYAQSVCAYAFLERVSPATSAVVGTARKPFIVVVAVIAFGRTITLLNAFGIALAFGGVFWFNFARHAEEKARKRQGLLSPAMSPAEGDTAATDDADVPVEEAQTASVLHAFTRWYEHHLARSPLLVKAITSGILYGAGDLVAQLAVAYHAPTHPRGHRGGAGADPTAMVFDAARFLRAVVYGGIFYPPLAHVHYNFLEELVVVRWRVDQQLVPWVKTFIEQFVYWSYFSNAYYHIVIGALQGFAPYACLLRLSRTLWPTMKAQWALWVPAQVINFRFVPVRHQLNFVLTLSLVWTTFLSLTFPPEARAGVARVVSSRPVNKSHDGPALRHGAHTRRHQPHTHFDVGSEVYPGGRRALHSMASYKATAAAPHRAAAKKHANKLRADADSHSHSAHLTAEGED